MFTESNVLGTNEYESYHRKRINLTMNMLRDFVNKEDTIGNIGYIEFTNEVEKILGVTTITSILPKDSPDEMHSQSSIELDLSDPNSEVKFDVLIFTEVLEHLLTEDELVMENLMKILNPNGILCISVPNALSLGNRIKLLFGINIFWTKHDILHGVYGGFGHIREYSLSEIRSLLKDKFEVLLEKGLNTYESKVTFVQKMLPRQFSQTLLFIAKKLD